MNDNQTTPSGGEMVELFADQLVDDLAALSAESLPVTASPVSLHCIGSISSYACAPSASPGRPALPL